MPRVSELMSQNISNSIVNYNTWGSLIINVKSYGAIGDGVADDTEAIQKAINDAVSKGMTEVHFPPGTYKYTTLTNTEGIYFVGDGVTLNGITQVPLVSVAAQLADKATKDSIYVNVKQPPPPLMPLAGDYDYTNGSGTDDTAALQALIDYCANKVITMGAGAEGLTLFFPVGAYRITATLDMRNNKRVSLEGLGKTKSMLVKTFGTDPLLDLSGSNNNRININNMAMCGPIGAISGSVFYSSGGWNQIYIQNCWFSAVHTLIEALSAGDFIFSNNTVEYIRRTFLIGDPSQVSSDITIADNMFYAYGPQGAGTQPNPFNFLNCHRVIVRSNKIIYDAALGASNALINIENCSNFVVNGNVVYDKISGIPARLIRVKSSQKINISGNELARTGLHTVDINDSRGVTVSQNGFIGTTDATYRPVHVTGGSEDVTVTQNEFAQIAGTDYSNLANTYDILIDASKRVTVRDNKLRKAVYVQSNASRYKVIDNQRSESGASVVYYNNIPQYGAWEVGDSVMYPNPAAGGDIGCICVSSGTPGTWKGFGAIEA